MFLQIIEDIGTHIKEAGVYAIEFATNGLFLLAFLRFWRKDQLCRVFLKRTGRIQGQTHAEVFLLSYIMGAFPTKPALISCTGSSARTIQLIDQSRYSTFGVQRLPRFEELNLNNLMHKRSQSVYGRINFFSVLRYLVICLFAILGRRVNPRLYGYSVVLS